MASQWPKDINRHPTTIRIKRLKDLLTHVILTSCVWRDLLGFNRWTLTQPDIGTKGALVKAVVFCYLENATKRRRIRLCGCSTLLDTGFGSHAWGTKTEATVCVPLAKCVSWFVKQWVSPNGISSARSGRHLDSSSFCEILKLFPQLLSSSSSSADVTLNWIHQTVHFTKCWATSIFQLLVWLPQTHQITWPFLIPIARQLLQSLWMQISTLVISCLRPKATKQHFGRVWVTIALTEGQMDRWSRVRRTGKP